MAFCTKCGQVLREGTMFCVACGAPVASAQQAAPAAPAAPVQPVQNMQPAPQPMPQAQPMAQQPAPQPMPQPQPMAQQPAPQPAPQPQPAQVPPVQNMQPAPQPMPQPQPMAPQPMPQPQPAQVPPAQNNQPAPQPMAQQPVLQDKPKKKTPLGLILGLAGGGLVLLLGAAAAIYFFLLKPVTIDLDPFISIETSGYDSKGKAYAKFDYDGFEMTYGDKLRKKNRKIPDPSVKFTHEVIGYSLSQTDNLSNGDQITLKWNNDDVLAKSYKCKLVCNDFTDTVSGLEEVEFIDPFQWVSVSISGTAPRAYAKYSVDTSSEILNHITYRFSNDENLKYGESISLYVESDLSEDDMMEQYGVVLEPREKSYTVENISRYAEKIKDVPTDKLDAINEFILGSYAEIFEEGDLISMECIGLYMYTLNNQSAADDFNQLYFVYEVTVKQKRKLPDFTFYSVIGFKDIVLDPKGEDNIDINNLEFSGVRDETPDHYYYYTGYDSFESMYKDIVEGCPGNYTIDSTVDKEPEILEDEEEDEDIL